MSTIGQICMHKTIRKCQVNFGEVADPDPDKFNGRIWVFLNVIDVSDLY